MKAFIPSLIPLFGVAVLAGILIAISYAIDKHYGYKVKHGGMNETQAEKEKATAMKYALIIVGVILALAYVGAMNYTEIEQARKEERENAKEEWYQAGYNDGYEDGYSDGAD